MTRHVAGDVQGYGGPINLWVRFDAQGTLEQAVLRQHNETPDYVRGVPAWLGLLEGHRLDRPLTGPHGVDALSGATVTCDAVLQILERSRQRAARDLLGLATSGSTPKGPDLWARLFNGPKAWVVAVFLLLLVPLSRWGGWRARLLGLVASFAVLGIWLNVPFTVVDVASLSFGVLPGGGEKAVLVLGVLLLTLAFGQLWCGYGCPFGAAQELLWLVFHPRGVDGSARLGGAAVITPALEQRARYVKFMLLPLVLCFFWISGDPAYLTVDPMTSAFSSKMGAVVVALLVIIGLASLLLCRPFCRYLCPAGAFLALGNKVRLAERVFGERLVRRRRVGHCDLGVTSQAHLDCLKCNRCLVSPPEER